jgi:phosphoglycolate phosphatase
LVRLVVFDLDGTLVDSKRDLADSANQLLVESGAHPLTQDEIGSMVGNGAPVLVARAFEAVDAPQPIDAVQRFLSIYQRRLLVHTRPYAGIPEALAALSHHASLAVLTNKPIAATRTILQGLDLARYFDADAIVGGDGPFPRKPDPAGLRHLAARVEIAAADTLLVGDSVVDLRTAHAAPSALCMARYGFGFEGLPVSELHPGDLLIDAPVELLSLVNN